MRTKTRVTVDLSPEDYSILCKLQERLGEAIKANILRDSLRLLDLLTEVGKRVTKKSAFWYCEGSHEKQHCRFVLFVHMHVCEPLFCRRAQAHKYS